MRSGRNVFWGMAFVLAAVLIIFDAVGVMPDLPLTKIVLGGVCFAWAVKELVKLNISKIYFPLSFLFMIFEAGIAGFFGLDENIISNWLLLLAALLMTVGTGLIFGKRDFRAGHANAFGEKIRYIDCAAFKSEYIKNSYGEYHVYFQNVEAYDGGGRVKVENSFGEVVIHVPSDWNVTSSVSNVFGDVPSQRTGSGKTLDIVGKNSFGELRVQVEK